MRLALRNPVRVVLPFKDPAFPRKLSCWMSETDAAILYGMTPASKRAYGDMSNTVFALAAAAHRGLKGLYARERKQLAARRTKRQVRHAPRRSA
jgi:hypothetical protein